MRLLLISAPHADTFGYSMPPPGLLRLGGWLRERGIDVLLEDLAYRLAAGDLPEGDFLAEAAADLLRARLDVPFAGTTCLGISTMGATLPIGLAIAERVRATHPDVPILLGGPGTNGVDEALIERFGFLDGVLRGEGEEALAELLVGTEPQLAGLAGFTWRAPDGSVRREADRVPLADLDAVAAPAWELLPSIAAYKRITGADDGLVPVDSGRGCAFDCSFCSIGRTWRRRSRCLSPARLADEIEALGALPGAKAAYLCHDIFGADRRHALAFCAEMARRKAAGRVLPFEVRARIDHLDDELVDAMAAAGCYRVLVGIESASEKVRALANKDLGPGKDPVELLRRVFYLADAGITPILSLILGLPGEERDDLATSLDFVARAAAGARAGGAQISLHLVNPQPGCALGEELGEGSEPVPDIPPDMALGAGTTAPERALIAAHPDLFSTWHLLTNQVGGPARLRELHALSTEVPEVLMRYAQTHAALVRVSGLSTLELFEARRAAGLSFVSQARRAGEPSVDAMLAWEQAKLRAAARGGPWRQGELDFGDGGPPLELQLQHEPLQLELDVAVAALTLAAGQPLPAPTTSHFLIGRSESRLRSITTRRISRVLFELFDALYRALRTGSPPPPRELVEHLATLEGGSLLRLTATLR